LSETANVVSARPREARAGKSAKFLGTPKTVFKRRSLKTEFGV